MFCSNWMDKLQLQSTIILAKLTTTSHLLTKKVQQALLHIYVDQVVSIAKQDIDTVLIKHKIEGVKYHNILIHFTAIM